MIRSVDPHRRPLNQDAHDLADDARHLLVELDREVPGAAAINAECRPPLDVYETATAIEIVMDAPGVAPDSIRIAIRRNTLLIVGAKMTPAPDADARYHLAERSQGRFARAVRLTGSVDAGRAQASTAAGELRIVLPRLDDRRGRMVMIPVNRA